MSSVTRNLIANEQVVAEARKHWIAPVRDSLVPGSLIVVAAVVSAILPSGDGLLGFLWSLIGVLRWGLLIFGLLWIAYNVVVWRTAAFAVTNLRVLRYEGLVQKRSSETLLSAVSDVRLRVGLFGSRLGYGDLEIFTQSGAAGSDRFLTITDAAAFRNAMMTVKIDDEMARRATPAPAAAPAPVTTAAHPKAAPVAPTGEDHAASLLRLADLRDKGVITPDEFEAKKREILARM